MRETVSKRDRFEVFKRDKFTCQYCGRKPPVVVLNIDHVLAISAGGDGGVMNLLTACEDCNSGKSDKPLDRILIPSGPSSEERRERLDQLQAYQKSLQEERLVMDEWMDSLVEKWCMLEGQSADSEVWKVWVPFEQALKKFVRRLMLEEFSEAIDLAWERFPDSQHRRFQYFCGICWKKIKDNDVKHGGEKCT